MEVELNKTYPLAVSAERAWAVLADIRAVGGCMPGAQITDQVDETHYKGLVKSKVGPAVMSFTGDIEVLALDVAARRIELLGKGADRGGSSAAMKLVARLTPAEGEACVLAGDATVTVSGKLAQFGGRLLVPIADAMLAQFAKNFEKAAAAVEIAPAPAAAEPMPVEAAVARLAEPADDFPATVAAPVEAAPAVAAVTPPLAAPVAAPRPLPVAAALSNELNALSLAWLVVRSWFLGLFGKKTA